jgi:hypothetical protein
MRVCTAAYFPSTCYLHELSNIKYVEPAEHVVGSASRAKGRSRCAARCAGRLREGAHQVVVVVVVVVVNHYLCATAFLALSLRRLHFPVPRKAVVAGALGRPPRLRSHLCRSIDEIVGWLLREGIEEVVLVGDIALLGPLPLPLAMPEGLA